TVGLLQGSSRIQPNRSVQRSGDEELALWNLEPFSVILHRVRRSCDPVWHSPGIASDWKSGLLLLRVYASSLLTRLRRSLPCRTSLRFVSPKVPCRSLPRSPSCLSTTPERRFACATGKAWS